MRSTARNGIAMARSGTSTRREPKMLKARDAAYAHLYTIGEVTWHDDDGPVDRRTTPKRPSPMVSSSSADTTSLGVRPPRRGSGIPGSCSRSKTTSSTKYATLPARPASPKRRRNHGSGRSHGTFQLSIAVQTIGQSVDDGVACARQACTLSSCPASRAASARASGPAARPGARRWACPRSPVGVGGSSVIGCMEAVGSDGDATRLHRNSGRASSADDG
eukprot:scaffold43060_cov56-Phaeocystis_antarctica.AAC.7